MEALSSSLLSYKNLTSTKKTIKSLKKADGLVVGSAICKEITKSIEKRQNTVTNVTKLVLSLKNKTV